VILIRRIASNARAQGAVPTRRPKRRANLSMGVRSGSGRCPVAGTGEEQFVVESRTDDDGESNLANRQRGLLRKKGGTRESEGTWPKIRGRGVGRNKGDEAGEERGRLKFSGRRNAAGREGVAKNHGRAVNILLS